MGQRWNEAELGTNPSNCIRQESDMDDMAEVDGPFDMSIFDNTPFEEVVLPAEETEADMVAEVRSMRASIRQYMVWLYDVAGWGMCSMYGLNRKGGDI